MHIRSAKQVSTQIIQWLNGSHFSRTFPVSHSPLFKNFQGNYGKTLALKHNITKTALDCVINNNEVVIVYLLLFSRSSTSFSTKPCSVSSGHRKTRRPSSPTTTVPSWWELPAPLRALNPWCKINTENLYRWATAFCSSSSDTNRTPPDARLYLQLRHKIPCNFELSGSGHPTVL